MCRTWAQQQPKVHRLASELCSNMQLPFRMSWTIGNVCWGSCTSSQGHRFALLIILVKWHIRKSCGNSVAKAVSCLHRGQEEGKVSAEERLRVCELRVRQFRDILTAAEAAPSSTPQGQWWELARQFCQNMLSVLHSRSDACLHAHTQAMLQRSTIRKKYQCLLKRMAQQQVLQVPLPSTGALWTSSWLGWEAMRMEEEPCPSQLQTWYRSCHSRARLHSCYWTLWPPCPRFVFPLALTRLKLVLERSNRLCFLQDMPPPSEAMEPSQTHVEPPRPDIEEYDPEFGE